MCRVQSNPFVFVLFQMHRGTTSGINGHRLHNLGAVAESCGFDFHGLHILPHRLSETTLHEKVHLKTRRCSESVPMSHTSVL